MVVLASMRYGQDIPDLIQEKFGLRQTCFWQKVWRLVDDPEMAAVQPVEVNRLKHMREAHRQARTGRS